MPSRVSKLSRCGRRVGGTKNTAHGSRKLSRANSGSFVRFCFRLRVDAPGSTARLVALLAREYQKARAPAIQCSYRSSTARNTASHDIRRVDMLTHMLRASTSSVRTYSRQARHHSRKQPVVSFEDRSTIYSSPDPDRFVSAARREQVAPPVPRHALHLL